MPEKKMLEKTTLVRTKSERYHLFFAQRILEELAIAVWTKIEPLAFQQWRAFVLQRFFFNLLEQLVHFQESIFIAIVRAFIAVDCRFYFHSDYVADSIASIDGAFATIATVMDHGQVSRDGKQTSRPIPVWPMTNARHLASS